MLLESRDALCRAVDALSEIHADALTVVGAHAVYERTQELALQPSATKDADLAVTPALVIDDDPTLEAVMRRAGFTPLSELESVRAGRSTRYRDQPGLWGLDLTPAGTPIGEVDLLVPESVAGAGRRGAGALRRHGKTATRRTPGLELAVLDRDRMTITNLRDGSQRQVWVAGTAGLLCAKAYKLAERLADPGRNRVHPKDAADVWRLIAVSDPARVRAVFTEYEEDPDNGRAVRTGLSHLESLCVDGALVRLAIDALRGSVPEPDVETTVTTWFGAFTALAGHSDD